MSITKKIKERAERNLFLEETTLRDYIRNQRDQLIGYIHILPIEKVDTPNEEKLLNYCIRTYSIPMIQIYDRKEDINYELFNRDRQVEFFIPFEGERELLTISPYSEMPDDMPQGRLSGSNIVLTFKWIGVDVEEIKAQLHREIEHIRNVLKETERIVSEFNNGIPEMASDRIRRRREELQAEIEKKKKLGYRKRGD